MECVCVIVPAEPSLPGHAGRHQGHTHTKKKHLKPLVFYNYLSYELFVNPIDLLETETLDGRLLFYPVSQLDSMWLSRE